MLPFSLSCYRLRETAEPIENTAFQAFFGVKLPSYHTFSHIEENIFLTFTYFFLLYKGEFCPVTWVTGNFYLNGSSSCSYLSIVSTDSNPSLSMLSFSRRNTHLIGLPSTFFTFVIRPPCVSIRPLRSAQDKKALSENPPLFA